MFILRSALRNLSRSKGRSLLIGILITVIAFSSCIGLAIRQAAKSSRAAALADMTVTAQITPDRTQAISSGQKPSAFKELSLSTLQKYAKAGAVKSFYYTATASLDGSGGLEAYSNTSSDSSSQSGSSSSSSSASGASASTGTSQTASLTTAASATEKGNDGKGFPEGKGMQMGDFTLVGASSDDALTDFTSGTSKIKSGAMFDTDTSDLVCVISQELASANSLKVGSTITLANPNSSKETYKLKVVGIYQNSQSAAQAMAGPQGMSDPANTIYTSYNALKKITDASSKAASSSSTAISSRLNATYVVGSVSGYNKFKSQVKELGLSSGYTVTSADLTSYERSAASLEQLAKLAGWFLVVILAIGAVILVIMSVFSTRERKYEIGVLTAIGMKKREVARLFVTELAALALCGAIIGGGIGAAVSKPVTNKLLSKVSASQVSAQMDRQEAFGRDSAPQGAPGQDSKSGTSKSSGNGSPASQITSITKNPVNGYVVLELLGACLLLTVCAGAVSAASILRYEPLDILSGRD